jgi:arsenate reductase
MRSGGPSAILSWFKAFAVEANTSIWRGGRCEANDARQISREELTLPITIYGIKNCDTMKKARAWLDSHGVAYSFHDYKTEGIAKDKLKQWSDEIGWETLLNRAGTTFRKLPDGDREGLNERKALTLMLAQPSMIKRPVLDLGGKLLVGFKPEIYAKEVASSGGSRRGKSGA